jgi:RND family efflux transporter MFP subunit
MSEQRHAALAIHPLNADDDGGEHKELLRRRQIVRRTRIIAVVVLVLLGAGAARTMFVRAADGKALVSGGTERAMQYVRTTSPKAPAAGQTLTLPGTLQGSVETPINARASGYLVRWTKDIGSKVNKGDLLAEIETPEIDQQLSQGIAAEQQAQSGLDLSKSTVARWEQLRQKDVVSQQDLEERRGAVAAATANLASAHANVQRLRQTEAFKRVLAPFSGVITRRTVNVGDLIDAGGGGGSRSLFTLAITDPLRVYINVPQAYTQSIKPGQAVTVTQAELRSSKFTGEIARSSGAIDPVTHMMQVEVSLPNKDNVLLPGAYVQVALPLQVTRSLTVPQNVLLFRAEGTRVAVVDDKGIIHLKPVVIGRNFGQNVELVDGVVDTDHIVLNPSDSLAEGDHVAIAPETAPKDKDVKAPA